MSSALAIKKGFLSPYEMGALAQLSAFVRQAGIFSGEKVADVENAFYATAFQSGVEQFLVWPLDKDKLKVSDFVKERICFLSPRDHSEHRRTVHNVFVEHLPADYTNNEEYTSVRRLEYFLQDVLVAVHSKSSLLTAFELPDIAELEIVLPTSLLLPVRNLLTSVQYETVALPVPRLIISSEDVKRYQEILTSDLFSKYSHAQEELEHDRNAIGKALENVVRTGRRVFASNRTVLTLRSTVLGILSVTPRLVETAFGRLPGALSEVACKAGLALMGDRRNFVLYTFDALLWNVATREFRRTLTTPEMYAQFLEFLGLTTQSANGDS